MNKKLVIYGLIEMIIIIALVVAYLWYKTTAFYDVVFSENGTIIERVKVKKNSKVSIPKSVKRDGYKILYYIGGEEYNFDNKVTESIVINVKYIKIETKKPEKDPDVLGDKKNVYLVTFDTQGGNLIDKIEVEEGSKVTQPTNPTKEGFEFVEWQLNGTKYDFEAEVKENITLVASWKEVPKPEPQPQQPQPQPQQPTPQPQQPVVKNYTFNYRNVDAYSPDVYIMVYENGNQIGVKAIQFTDGTPIPMSAEGSVSKVEIESESALRVVLNNGTVVTATKQ